MAFNSIIYEKNPGVFNWNIYLVCYTYYLFLNEMQHEFQFETIYKNQ